MSRMNEQSSKRVNELQSKFLKGRASSKKMKSFPGAQMKKGANRKPTV